MTSRAAGAEQRLMTVGELSRRTALSIKAIREYEDLGLIYSAGRSDAGYRLFDESALWCAEVVVELRALGLTIKEIGRIADAYRAHPDEPIGPQIAIALDRAERRTEEQIEHLRTIHGRIGSFTSDHAAALAGHPDAALFPREPRRRMA